ncbi:MAG: hypothetical protein ACSLFK_12875 [Gemmatimonadaceae bacterium]
MKESSHLALTMVLTFAAMRIWLGLTPDADFDVGGYNIHHLFTGVVLLTACTIPLVVRRRRDRLRRILLVGFGVGLALVLDEWVYLIVTDGSNASYLLPVSFWGGAIAIAVAAAYTLLVGRAKATEPDNDS